MQKISFSESRAAKAEAVTVPVTALSHDGRGIGFLPSKEDERKLPVFIPKALPGQTVKCQITKKPGRYLEAAVSEVIIHNPFLLPPQCPHWKICGGCPLLPLPYSTQLKWKEKIALDAMTRIGKIPLQTLQQVMEAPVASPRLYRYRNKLELAFGFTRDGNAALGFREAGSHRVFELGCCLLAEKDAARIARTFAGLALNSGLPVYNEGHGYWRFLILRKSEDNNAWVAHCVTSPGGQSRRAKTRELGASLMRLHPAMKGFIHSERHARDYRPLAQKRVSAINREGIPDSSAALLNSCTGGMQFALDVDSFFQINANGNELLVKKILDMADTGQNLLDLYGGAGAPGLCLASAFTSVHSIEGNRKASAFSIRNAKLNGIKNWSAQAGNVEEALSRLTHKKWDLCLLDPPRAGLSPKALSGLLDAAPEKIIYVSCNPATLARDSQTLSRNYDLKRFASVDLFPHTPHLECLCLWSKKRRPVAP